MLIYLTDDDVEDQELFQEALYGLFEDLELKLFSNGVALIAELLNPDGSHPEVLFIDLNMPMMSGEECIADIRGEKKFDKIPIIVYSSEIDKSQMEQLKLLGANGYLQKPNTYVELKTKLLNGISILKRFSTGQCNDRFLFL